MRFQNVPARLFIAVGVCVVIALIAAGCGDSSGSSSGGEEATSTFPDAVKANEEFEQRPTSIGITTPVGKAIPKGKVIDFIQCGVPACATEGDIFEEAMQPLGWTLNRINAGTTPEEIKAAYQKAIGDDPDAVVSSGYPRVIFEPELQTLKSMGVPVVQSFVEDEAGNGLTAVVAGRETTEIQGKMLADYILAHTEDEAATFGSIVVDGFETVAVTAESLEKEVAKECPGCKVKKLTAPVTSIGSDLPQRITSFLTANPDIEWSSVGYNDMVVGLPTALKGAGIENAKLTTVNVNTSIAPYMAKGEFLQSTVGTTFPEVYWRVVDLLARLFTDQSYAVDTDDSTLPYWTITADSLPSSSEEFPVVTDYQEQFKKLWGVE